MVRPAESFDRYTQGKLHHFDRLVLGVRTSSAPRPRQRSHHTSSRSFSFSELSHRNYSVFHRHHSTGTPQPQAPAAPYQKLAHTLTLRAAPTITSVARWHQGKVWPNCRSGNGIAPKSAVCVNEPRVASTSKCAKHLDFSTLNGESS